jgi:hypothetical protein
MTGYKCLPARAQAATGVASPPRYVLAASVPVLDDGKPAIWSGYKELRVRFLYDPSVNRVNYDENRIMEWANEWNQHGQLSIPKFRLARDNEPAEIRIKLNGIVCGKNIEILIILFFSLSDKKSCLSYIGREADGIDQNDVTMELDIHTGLPTGADRAIQYMKYLVMHEFGHALGLRHEHQRSDFWGSIIQFVDINRMKSSIKDTLGQVSDSDFEEYWDGQWSEQEVLVAGETNYDRKSIMHYW